MNEWMKRGEFLARKRNEKGLSVSELAKLLNVSEWQIERWENGELPDSEYLLSLSSALDVPVEDILKSEEKDFDSDAGKAQEDFAETYDTKTAYAESSQDVSEADSTSSSDKSAVSFTGRNGYSAFERKFGYTVFAVFIIIVIILSSIQFAKWLDRPRELTLDNYKSFIYVEVEPTRNYNCEEYIVRVSAARDISDLNLTVRVEFFCYGTGDVTRDVSFSGNIKKGESFEQMINTSEISIEQGFKVISVEGGLD